jgi:hypothetical protein
MQAPRMTTRRWMVAVAIVAILMGVGLDVGRRSRRFARLAADHSNAALEHFHTLMTLGGPPLLADIPPTEPGPLRSLHRENALVSYHSALTKKYQRAARYPWLPVAPEPPKPE